MCECECVCETECAVELMVEPTGETDKEKTDGSPKIPALFVFVFFSFCVTLLSLLRATN